MNEHSFKIYDQWQCYLERCRITESELSTVQRIEMKKAFYGAWGQLLILMRDDIPELSDEDGMKVFEEMMREVLNFWNETAAQYKKRNN